MKIRFCKILIEYFVKNKNLFNLRELQYNDCLDIMYVIIETIQNY